MKKSAGIITAVVIVGAAYVGASWYVGKRAQATLEQAVTQANERFAKALGSGLAGNGFKLAISDYNRHVFSSDVVYTLQIDNADEATTEYLFSDHLQHGPFPVGALKQGNFAPLLALSRAQLIPSAVTQKWFDSLSGQAPIVATTQVAFSGGGNSQWQFQPLDITQDGDSLTFSGGTLGVQFTKNFNDTTADGKFPFVGYVSAQAGEDLQIKGITLNSSSTTADDGSLTLQSSARADSVVALSSDADPLRAEHIVANLNSLQNGSLLEGSLRYDFGSLKVGEVDLGSLSVGAKGSGLNIDALTALGQEYDAISAAQGGGEIELSTDQEASLHEKLLAVLATDPSVAIDPFIWKNDQGESSLALSVSLSGEAAKAAGSTTRLDVLLPQIIKLLKLDASVSGPMFVKAFGQLQGAGADPQTAMIANMVFSQYASRLSNAGLVKAEGDKITTAMQYEKNSVVVNGQAMSMAEFMQRAISVLM